MAHFSDLELLELTNDNEQHLQVCSDCSERYKNLIGLRESASRIAEVTPPKSILNGLLRSTEVAISQSAIRFWRYTSISLAASLVITISYLVLVVDGKEKEQLDNLVLENQFLQTLVSEHGLGFEYSSNETLDILFYEIREADEELQRAYVDDASVESKILLWQERKLLMQKILVEERNLKKTGLSL